MALFRFCLLGLHDHPVVELDARDMQDLQHALSAGRFIRGRLDGEGESIEVLIPVSRIQLVLGITE
jgi:hypothetical protein